MSVNGENRERYDFEIATMRAHGTVADLGNGNCTLHAWFDDAASANKTALEFRRVHRQHLADMLRTLADQVAPPEGSVYAFQCGLHVDDLEGIPEWVHDAYANAWELVLDGMECRHAGDASACRPSWRVSALGVGRKEVA